MRLVITGVKEAVEKLNNISGGIDGVLERTRLDLANMGEGIVNQEYANEDGNNDYATMITHDDKTTVLSVSGEDVGFIEFGSGVMTMPSTFSGEVNYPVYEGSYSIENDGQFSKRGYWYYNGERYEGTLPRPGMAIAYETMLNSASSVLQENLKGLIR